MHLRLATLESARSGRRNSKLTLLATVMTAVFLATLPAAAQTLTWDANPTNPTAPNDGSGNWNTTTDANWSDGTNDFMWVTGDTASIGNGGTAGIITINDGSGTVSAAGINFNATGSGNYTIAPSTTETLTLTGTGTINLASGVSPTISAPIVGSAGLTVAGAGGTLNLTGNNLFTGAVAINSGTLAIGTGGNLGASTNGVTLGTSTLANVGTLSLAAGVSNTVNSFASSTNTATTNTLTIDTGASLNVTSNSAMSGLNTTTNSAFVVGSPNNLSAITTKLTVSGAGTLAVSGGTNNASFLVGVGNSNTSTNAMTATLDMSGLANFSFTTGTGAIPSGGGNEFAVGHGAGTTATATLAQNNTITAGTITVSDNAQTPGLGTGTLPNAPSNPSTLNLGGGTNVLNANKIIIGNSRTQGIIQWLSSTTTGSVTIAGAAGGSSTADITIGNFPTSGTPANSASTLNLSGHSALVQAGAVILGASSAATGTGSGTSKGGSVTFDTGTFNIVDLKMGVITGGTSGGSIGGTFNAGSGPSSTGVLNVSNSFIIAATTGGTTTARGTFNVKGGTANINANIVDISTGTSASVTTVALTGGTLNMNGFAIGTTAGGTGGTRTIGTVSMPSLGNTAALANLGGNGINNAGLNMNGTGVLVLEGTNTYTGGTLVSSGTLQVGQASDILPPSSALQSAVTVNSGATLAFGSSQPLTISTVISNGVGAGAVRQNGTGTTTLTGISSYSGPTSLVAGVLSVSAIGNAGAGGTNSRLGSSSNAAGNVILSGGTLQYAGAGESTDRLFSVTPTNGAIDSSGAGAINFSNGGPAVSADPASRAATIVASQLVSAKITLPDVSDLVNGMHVNDSGAGGQNLIPAGATIIAINPATNSVTLSAPPTAISSGADTINFPDGIARTLSLTGTNTGNNTMGDILADSAAGGTLGLTKNGTGTWLVTANNTYTGPVQINNGTLAIDHVAATGAAQPLGQASSAILLGSATAATLQYTGGTASLSRDITVNGAGGGAINNTGGGTLTLGGTLTKNGANLTLSGSLIVNGKVTGALANSDLIVSGGNVTLNNSANDYNGATTVNGGTLNIGHYHALGSAPALNVNGTSTARLVAALAQPLVLNSLSIAGGALPTATLDVTNNNIVIHNGDIGTTLAQLKSGLNASGTLWTGAGIQSSTAAADAATNTNSTVFAVGAIKNIDKNNNLIYGTWPAPPSPDTGVSGLTTTDVLVKYTYFGDANLDGVVDNTSDYDLWSTGFTNPGLAATNGWLYGDFDFSGTVDNTTDYDLWSTGFTHQGGPLAGSAGSQTPAAVVQPVPEPTSIALAALGLTILGMKVVSRRRSGNNHR
jgi:autotransporter-associated beta strand protein